MLNSDVLSVIHGFNKGRPEHIREWCDTVLLAKWVDEWGRPSHDFEHARSRMIQFPRSIADGLFLNDVAANKQVVLQELFERIWVGN